MALEDQAHAEVETYIVSQTDLFLLKYACIGIFLGIITLMIEPVVIGWYRRRCERNKKISENQIAYDSKLYVIENI